MRWIIQFVRDEDAVTAVEYAVMLSMIIMACVVAINTLTTNVRDSFQDTGNRIGAAMTTGS